MNLELKHLAPYLPYGLKAKAGTIDTIVEVLGLQKGSESVNNELFIFCHKTDYLKGYLYECKPILRPLSDLTKEITCQNVDYPFTPMNELFGGWDEELYTSLPNHVQHTYQCSKGKVNSIHLQQWIFQELIKWHFDVFGLIDEDLAIDINTLKS